MYKSVSMGLMLVLGACGGSDNEIVEEIDPNDEAANEAGLVYKTNCGSVYDLNLEPADDDPYTSTMIFHFYADMNNCENQEWDNMGWWVDQTLHASVTEGTFEAWDIEEDVDDLGFTIGVAGEGTLPYPPSGLMMKLYVSRDVTASVFVEVPVSCTGEVCTFGEIYIP